MIINRMIDFESIVEGLLLEADDASQPDSADVEENEAKTVYAFFKNNYGSLKDAFVSAYGTRVYIPGFSVFPNELAFKNLVYNASKNSIRDTKKSNVFPDFMYIFPLLDIISQVKAIYVESKSSDKPDTIAKEALNAFVNKLKTKYKNTLPMDYVADDAWATTVKESFLSSNKKQINVGALKLPAFANYSLHYTIFKLLEQRKIGYNAKIEINKLPETNKVVEKVLFNPDVYTSAEQIFPDLKLKSFYYGVTPDLLLSVAKSVQNLFEQQAREKLSEEDYTKLETNTMLKSQMLENLYKNQLDWRKYGAKKTSPQQEQLAQSIVSQDFDQSFELLSKQMLNEMKPTSRTTYSSDGSKTTTTSGPGVVNVKSTTTTTTPPSSKVAQANPKEDAPSKITQTFIDNKYSVGEIIKYTNQKVTVAEEVHNSLLRLADHIRTETERNVLGKISGALSGAAQIAKGLSGGVPTMGGR
jgi:hypothetical protein